ncbi:MAG: SDR family oxidoreductase [Candidatus Melainabacteria bacterium]|jgi:dTDP-glucose 4,6-dehydratase|nr:SDR family oxidoreductase [Candidatus Melainabacteria bacterium]
MNQTILITGGAGFIGSHLADRLIKDGNKIIVLDNLVTGRTANIEHLLKVPGFKFVNHNVSEFISIEEDLDWVMHFASPASPVDFKKLAIPILKVGSLGTHNALGLAREKNAKFFLASTSEVYGDPLVHPQPESYFGNVNPIGPRAVYDESKRFAEAITMAYYREHNIDTRIIRIFNTYGPRMRVDDGRVVCSFLSQALAGKDITVFGDGSQTRSFQYVDDLIEGIVRLMSVDFHEPVNLGNPHEFTMLELADKIQAIVSSSCQLKFEALTEDDPKRRKPDISRAKQLLDWQPKIELEQGLEMSIDYFKSLQQA